MEASQVIHARILEMDMEGTLNYYDKLKVRIFKEQLMFIHFGELLLAMIDTSYCLLSICKIIADGLPYTMNNPSRLPNNGNSWYYIC